MKEFMDLIQKLNDLDYDISLEEELEIQKDFIEKRGIIVYLNNFFQYLPGLPIGMYRGTVENDINHLRNIHKYSGKSNAEFFKDIDTSLRAKGVYEKVKFLLQGKRDSTIHEKACNLVLPVYIKLRKEGYSRRQLIN